MCGVYGYHNKMLKSKKPIEPPKLPINRQNCQEDMQKNSTPAGYFNFCYKSSRT